MTSKVCKRNQFAHCKFGKFCFYEHEDRKCTKIGCSDRKCPYRHPAPCRNILQKKIWPWGSTCSFDHGEKNSNEPSVLETSYKNKIKKFEALLKGKDCEIQKLRIKIVKMTKLEPQRVKKVMTRATPVYIYCVVMLNLLKLLRTTLVTTVTKYSRKDTVYACI